MNACMWLALKSTYLPEGLKKLGGIVEESKGESLGVMVLQDIDNICGYFDGDIGFHCKSGEIY